MKIPKKVTAAKAAANQKNAKNSTGPTSELGRRNSSRNATRLGIFSRDMLLPGERTTDLQQLRNELMIDLAPVGALELDQVEIYLANRWRLPRVYRAEAGEIGKSISEYRPGAEVASSDHTREYQQGMSDITKLKSIEKLLKQKARVSSEDLDWLRKLPYGDAGDVLALAIEPAQDAEREQDPSPTGEMSAGPESAKSSGVKTAARSQGDGGYARDVLLSMLDQLKDCVLLEIMRHGRQVVSVMEAKKNTFQVPQEAVLNRQTRYENHLMRNVYRALHELERLQRIRFGDEVLPPPRGSTNRNPGGPSWSSDGLLVVPQGRTTRIEPGAAQAPRVRCAPRQHIIADQPSCISRHDVLSDRKTCELSAKNWGFYKTKPISCLFATNVRRLGFMATAKSLLES